MKTVQMPKWVAACLIVATLSSMTVAFSQLTGYTLTKPYTLTITTASSPLSIESISFNYDPSQNRWTTCNMQISNSNMSATATVYVYLKNSAGANVAQGQLTQTFPTGTTAITVSLSWTGSYTADDVASGYAVIQP